MFATDLLPLIITVAGAFFLIRLRFFFIAHPLKVIGKIKNTVKDKSSRKTYLLRTERIISFMIKSTI